MGDMFAVTGGSHESLGYTVSTVSERVGKRAKSEDKFWKLTEFLGGTQRTTTAAAS